MRPRERPFPLSPSAREHDTDAPPPPPPPPPPQLFALREVLGDERARDAVWRQPMLLGLSPDTLRHRLERLGSIAKRVPLWQEHFLHDCSQILVRPETRYVRLEDIAAHYRPLEDVTNTMASLLAYPTKDFARLKYIEWMPAARRQAYGAEEHEGNHTGGGNSAGDEAGDIR